MTNLGGPQLLGMDVLWVATLLSVVASIAVMIAIYSVVTVRDPMAKRVKALNDRREQLKAGITATTSKKRAKLVRKTRKRVRLVHHKWSTSQSSSQIGRRCNVTAEAHHDVNFAGPDQPYH